GNGEWLTNRPETELPQKGESTDIEINYNELDVEVTLNGEELFDFSFNDDVSALFDEKSALKLGQYGQENSQFLIETDQDDNGSEGGDDGDDGDNGDGGDDGDDGDNGDGDDGDEPEGDKKAGDFEVISDNGSLTYNGDRDSVTFHSEGTAKNKIVYTGAELQDGTFEADITPDRDLTRFGMIY